jgi:hypothetical protein
MAKVYWLGIAPVVAQVAQGVIASVDAAPANNTFTITIGGVSISQVGTVDVATTATALRASLNASTHPYFSAITWSGAAGNIVGTADVAGVPFIFAISKSGAGTGTVTAYSVTTANAGPNDWSTAANWSGGAVPVNTDDVIIGPGAVNIVWGLAQSAVTLNSLQILKSYTGLLGLNTNAFATTADAATVVTTANEYRQAYLNILVNNANNLVRIGENYGPVISAGSQRIMLDLGATATTVIVYGSAQAANDSGKPCIRLKMNSATTNVYVRSAPGGVGIAVDQPSETSTVGTVNCSDSSSATRVTIGLGTTITTFSQDGGNNVLQAAATVTTVTVNGGTLLIEGTFAVTTLTIYSGTVIPNSSGTITTMNIYGGTVDLTQSDQARTVTTTNVYGTNVTFKNLAVTLTNQLAFNSRKYSLSIN